MEIATQPAKVQSLSQMRSAADKNVQNVFSEVLRGAGRSGFASAVEGAEKGYVSQSLEERIQETWGDWFQTAQLGRYASPQTPTNLGESFGHILGKAYEQGGYVAPHTFLSSLSGTELTTVQRAHLLADPIQVDSLSEEGALNLLLPPAAQVDLNRDGLTQSGTAYSLKFPDSSTPPAVVQAWEQATDGMPEGERMTYELKMKLPVLLANIEIDQQGRYVRTREPGDPDFVNPMDSDSYSFDSVAQSWMDHLTYLQNQIDPAQYAKDMEFWTAFQGALRRPNT